MKIKTQINKLGRNSKDQKGFINPPIYKGSTIIFKNYKQYKKEKSIYEGLYGLNRTPNSDALESALKELYKCDSVVAVSSGLAAVSIPLVSLLSKDQHIIVTDSLYSPTRKFIENQLFATLTTTTRRLDLAKELPILLSDTVGFIHKLPHNLVASFR